MNAQLLILKYLDKHCRELNLDDSGYIQWSDGQLLRSCTLRAERGDPSGWQTFIEHLREFPRVAWGFRWKIEEQGWAKYSVEHKKLLITLPNDISPLGDCEVAQLLSVLVPKDDTEDAEPARSADNLGKIMYIEEKPGLTGHARIGRVQFSATRKTLYYAGRKLSSLKGSGFKANYFNVESGLEYWISNCKKRGDDSLYPNLVEIDEDAREEYWTRIRQLPENAHLKRFRSVGKYSKHRPA